MGRGVSAVVGLTGIKKLLKEYDVGTLDSRQAHHPPESSIGENWAMMGVWTGGGSQGPQDPPKSFTVESEKGSGIGATLANCCYKKKTVLYPNFQILFKKINEHKIV